MKRKRISTMRKAKMLILLCLFGLIDVEAGDFGMDGIIYKITGDQTVEVSSRIGKYSGDIVIPSSITYEGITYFVTGIGYDAFRDCDNLTSVVIPNSVTYIGSDAFAFSESLTNITIPNSVTGIGYDAFRCCDGLTSITIPNSVTGIGYQAFYGCSSLTNVNIGNSVKEIGLRTFASCENLSNITIGSSIATIDSTAFQGCTSLPIIDNIRYADTYAFEVVDKTQTSYELKENTRWIRERAFSNCTKLRSITIPNSVISIGEKAFSDCPRLTNVAIGNSVEVIGKAAFSGCKSIETIDIPNSVTAIGESAFSNCSNLKNATIGSSVSTIGNSAFYDCSNLTNVIIGDNVLMIGAGAFFYCKSLTSVVIPNSVTTLGNSAFSGCYNLVDVNIGNSVTTIGDEAFRYCYALTNVILPNSVTTIGKYSFEECHSLTSIIIPNSVISIGESAFRNCWLNSVIIGSSVDEIGEKAFECGITDVTFLGTTPPWIYSDSFGNTENITFHVPEGCKEVYLASQDIWKNFTIVEGMYNFEAVDAEGNTIGLQLNYDDEENSTLTLLDTYRSLTVAQDIPLKHISYVRNFGNTHWQSLFLPFEIPVTTEFLEHFEVAYMNNVHQYDDDDDGTIDRTIVEFFKMKSGTLKANYPYVIKAKATGTQTITVNEATLYATEENSVDCRSTQYEYVFKGTYTRMEENELTGCYAMSGGGWKTLSAGSHLNPLRVYLRITPRKSGLAPLKSIGMRIIGEDGETTEINSQFIIDNLSSEEPPVFDFAGRRVENPTGGVYIVNGKKVVIR